MLSQRFRKQFFGACLGMGAAGFLYLAIDQASYLNIKGLLVSSSTISENAGIVSVNNTSVDDSVLRRLASRAQTVANQLQDANQPAQIASSAAPTELNLNAAARGQERSVALALSSAPTYDVNPNVVMTEKDRLAIRAARFQPGSQTVSNAPLMMPLKTEPLSNQSHQKDVSLKSSAPEVIDTFDTPVTSSHLPDSGPGLALLGLASLGTAALHRRRKLASV
jgi:MYXO-CTERM domain-containing protein